MPFAENFEKLVDEITTALADGKISVIEIFRIVKALILLLGNLITTASDKVSLSEYKD